MKMLNSFAANFYDMGASIAVRTSLYRSSTRYNWYRQLAQGYANRQLLHVEWVLIPDPAVRPELVEHIRTYLPNFVGFKSKVFTYVESNWNDIYGDFDPVGEAGGFVTEVVAPGQRGRLKQIFMACPEGSYGYYARFALAPFRLVVGNAFAATIDEFFASNVEFLNQELGPSINDIMPLLETKYWRSRDDVLEWLAGVVLSKRERRWTVTTAAVLMRLWEGRKASAGEQLSEQQLAEIAGALNSEIKKMDLAAVQAKATELYEQAVHRNLVKILPEKPEE